MKKIIIFSYTLLCFYSYSQINYKFEYDFTDRDSHTCNSTLYIIKNESLYRINDERENGEDKRSTQNKMILVNNDEISKVFYSNNQSAITRIPFNKSEIVYRDLNNKVKYKLTGKSKKISKYDCQEAKFNLNGRKYTVWFTPEIEINFGPYKINGFPGLITEIIEETNKIHIVLKSFQKLTDITEFQKYKKYILSKKVLDYDEYEKTISLAVISKKTKGLAVAAEYGAVVTYDENQSAFTQFLIDIPTNLVLELKKIN